ncbi:hypothetical protein [Streptosporangium sp. V21-05]|uniref:hypothetical protein n=1 Tax=Streptosporangium sp. V21-05 TaxID=3446115 RepID=UPI003F534DE7
MIRAMCAERSRPVSAPAWRIAAKAPATIAITSSTVVEEAGGLGPVVTVPPGAEGGHAWGDAADEVGFAGGGAVKRRGVRFVQDGTPAVRACWWYGTESAFHNLVDA